jgi:L,D-transpeptidase ErfK/SrfK
VVNIAEMRLYYYPKSKAGEKAVVITHPISIGRGDWQTPLAITHITTKVKNPRWYPPETIRKEHAERGYPLEKIVPAGPDNPLGLFALKLGLPSYLIHGTNRPSGIGMQVTHGCIRMYPEDIESLFLTASVGTPVYIVNQPYKAGWFREALYLEVHPPLEEGEKPPPEQSRDLTPVVRTLVEAIKGRTDGTLDWKQVAKLAANPSGIPVDVKFQQEKWESELNRIARDNSD